MILESFLKFHSDFIIRMPLMLVWASISTVAGSPRWIRPAHHFRLLTSEGGDSRFRNGLLDGDLYVNGSNATAG